MRRSYQMADPKDSRALAEFLAKEGYLLMPLLGLMERSEAAVGEVIEVVGRSGGRPPATADPRRRS